MKEDRGIIVFFSLLLLYLLVPTVVGMLTSSTEVMLAVKLLVVGAGVFYWRKWFAFKPKFDSIAILLGIVIAGIWIGLDTIYPHLSESEAIEYSLVGIVLKLLVGIILAPLIEEFFTRFFLHRFITAKKWLSVPLGKYHLGAFIVTTLFFGFAHSRWLVGLITGILLNILWYYRKDMNSVVVSHAVANAVLGILVIVFDLWQFW